MFCSNCGASQDASANFCSACGTRLAARKPAPPPEPRAEAPLRSLGIAGPEDMPQPVKVLDAAGRLLLSGARAEDVENALQQYLKQGAKVVTALCQVGKSWTAVCTMPPKAENLDQTQTLSFADLDPAKKATMDEPDDGCRVEELGFKRVVYGPSMRAVKLRVEFMKQFGAEMIGEIEEIDGEWTVICDFGDAKNTGYRW